MTENSYGTRLETTGTAHKEPGWVLQNITNQPHSTATSCKQHLTKPLLSKDLRPAPCCAHPKSSLSQPSMLQNYLSVRSQPKTGEKLRQVNVQTEASDMDCAIPEEISSPPSRVHDTSMSVELSVMDEGVVRQLPQDDYTMVPSIPSTLPKPVPKDLRTILAFDLR